MGQNEVLYRVETGYACFGLVVKAGIVRKAAPIARWTEGKAIQDILDYYVTKKKATYLVIYERHTYGSSNDRSTEGD